MRIKIINATDLFFENRWNTRYLLNENNKEFTKYDKVKLEKVFKERKEFLNPQDYKEQNFNYIGLENVKSNTGDLVNFEPKKGIEIRSRSKIFRQNDILYGRLRPNLNKVFLVDDESFEGICSTECFVLTPDLNIIMPCFLRYILSSKYVLNDVIAATSGAALPRLQLEDFLQLQIPFPPLNIQKKIENFIIETENERRELLEKVHLYPAKVSEIINKTLEMGELPSTDNLQFDEHFKLKFDEKLPISDYKLRRK